MLKVLMQFCSAKTLKSSFSGWYREKWKLEQRKICIKPLNLFLIHIILLKILIALQVLLREQETKRALDDAEIKALELEAQKRLFQQVDDTLQFNLCKETFHYLKAYFYFQPEVNHGYHMYLRRSRILKIDGDNLLE